MFLLKEVARRWFKNRGDKVQGDTELSWSRKITPVLLTTSKNLDH